jgi:arylformamidase
MCGARPAATGFRPTTWSDAGSRRGILSCFVDQAGAQFLLDQGISGVGIDGLGIERAQPGHETYEILLGNDIIVLEGLRLADVAEGSYLLVAAPLKLVGTEAAPVRAILIAE